MKLCKNSAIETNFEIFNNNFNNFCVLKCEANNDEIIYSHTEKNENNFGTFPYNLDQTNSAKNLRDTNGTEITGNNTSRLNKEASEGEIFLFKNSETNSPSASKQNLHENNDTSFPNSSYTLNNININADSSFMSLCEENLENLKPKNNKRNSKNPALHILTDSFNSESNIQSNVISKPLTSDKVVFIKNQLKNEIANFFNQK